MRKKPKVTSRILNAVHETARDLHRSAQAILHSNLHAAHYWASDSPHDEVTPSFATPLNE